MAKARPGHRIVLQLDPHIALEELIFNQLERIPATRRQEWLRGLLVQGFLSERQALRGAPDDVKRRSTSALTNGMAGGWQRSVSRPSPEPAVVKVRHSQANMANKPFAVLGRVIG